MLTSENTLLWFEFADADLNAAKTLSKSHPVPLEIVCFHCQQAAEKYLKAYLVSCDIDPPKTHKIDKLCAMCSTIDSRFDEIEPPCAFLTEFAVIPRYPHELDINEHHVHRALESAETVKNFEPLKALRETLPDNLVQITCTENQERDTQR